MSLKLAADHLASKGRGPDTLLVHMAPSEVAGLQSLAKAAGGSLTVNPDTGLPEAGFLEKLLPTLIGAGITAATGGAAAPWMIGAGIGGLEAMRTGDIGKGLTAGLGAYGGAGLTSGLADMGATALAQQAGSAAPQTMMDAAGVIVPDPAYVGSGAAAPAAGFGDKLAAGAKTWDWNKPMDFVSGLGGGSKGKGLAMLGGAFAPAVMAALEPETYAPGAMASDSTRAPSLAYVGGNQYRRMTDAEAAARKEKYGFAEGGLAAGGAPEWNKDWKPDVPEYGDLGQNFGREILYYNPALTKAPEAAKLTAPVLETASTREGDGGRGNDGVGGGQSFWGSVPGTGRDWMGNTLVNGISGPTTGISSGLNSLAATLGNMGFTSLSDSMAKQVDPNYSHEGRTGKGASGNPDVVDSQAALADAMANAMQGGIYGGGTDAPGANADGYGGGDAGFGGGSQPFAAGGLSSLGSYSDGGRLLRGPGDGVSDDIPATIGHAKQPARLADGEFVVSADVVSGLGNGSTEAGARKLYAMMDRVRKARTGRTKMGRTINADKLIPR